MKRIVLFISAVLFSAALFAQSNFQKNYENCSKCSDPWVGELYLKIWGACAGSGQSGACNIKEYNNGSWSGYENLKSIIRSKYLGSLAKGNVYIFTIPENVNYGLGKAGHIGWGFQLSDGSFFGGSTENYFNGNVKDAYWIDAGKDNGFWSERFPSEQAMFNKFKSINYSKYKSISWPNPNLANAKSRAEEVMYKGFQGVSNNCLDHTYYVLEGLGVRDMPWKQTNPTPNGWFDEWFKNITGKGNSL